MSNSKGITTKVVWQTNGYAPHLLMFTVRNSNAGEILPV